MERELILNKLD